MPTKTSFDNINLSKNPYQTSISNKNQLAQVQNPVRSVNCRPPKILIVEDCVSTRLVMQHYAKSLEVDAYCVGSGEEALDISLDMFFDIVFMDISLPGMNGLSAIRKLRRNRRTAQYSNFVICSAHTSVSEEKVPDGCRFLQKPVTRQKFSHKVEGLLSLS